MVYMPSLEIWEWGLKIFDGTNSHHSCRPSTTYTHYYTTNREHKPSLSSHDLPLQRNMVQAAATYSCTHIASARDDVRLHAHKPQHLDVPFFIKVMSGLQWQAHTLMNISPYTYTILIKQHSMSFGKLFKRDA